MDENAAQRANFFTPEIDIWEREQKEKTTQWDEEGLEKWMRDRRELSKRHWWQW